MTYSVNMLAPVPNQQFTCRSGNSYQADGNSFIASVVGQDIIDLSGDNCISLGPVAHTGLPWVTGRFYGLPKGMTSTTLLTVASVLYAYPLFIPNAVTLAALQVSVTTGQTGGLVEVGIYNDNNGYPSNLVAGTDTGDLDGTATAVVGPTNLAVALHAGWYWLAVQAKATSTMPTVEGFAAGYAAETMNLLGSDTAAHLLTAASDATMGIKKTSQTYAALPTNFPLSAALVINAGVPLVSLGV